ncbi:putative amidophosphoribosyltransferase [Aminobacter niigataensis]|uniref:Amidophosphoribosyltransferase n=1 Tax=Aminobacter niigataensis TaxID=83265 RepID=A0ABR6L2A8_9HYPH|nr:hypothetical protein [Aminobacter niigataensis]MBB4650888.1 putative amidophosphoribosyltransferase [Aminobacter niigataensis]
MIGTKRFFRPPLVTKEQFLQFREEKRAHRICFANTHANALAPYKGKFPYKFSVPFSNTIQPVFEHETGLSLHSSQYGGVWCGLSEGEKAAVDKFVTSRRENVFLRDYLDASVALSMHYDGQTRTAVGELEYAAKYHRDEAAISKLIDLGAAFVSSTQNYKKSRAIAPVPPRAGKDFDLPSVISAGICDRLKIDNVAAGIWGKEKAQLKEKSLSEKWDALETAKFIPNDDLKKYESIILVDDLYQSGCTINFVGNRLQHFSQIDIFGLSIVKSAGDQDNIK